MVARAYTVAFEGVEARTVEAAGRLRRRRPRGLCGAVRPEHDDLRAGGYLQAPLSGVQDESVRADERKLANIILSWLHGVDEFESMRAQAYTRVRV